MAMDKVKLGSNYPEITGNAVFYNHECFSRFGIEVEQVNPPKQGMTLNEALISGAVDVTPAWPAPLLAVVPHAQVVHFSIVREVE